MEDILIEGISTGNAFGWIENSELDISCSNESLLNQVYAIEIYKTDEDFWKGWKIKKEVS